MPKYPPSLTPSQIAQAMQAAQPDVDITGSVSRVLFKAAEKAFAIVQISRPGKPKIIAKGPFGDVNTGDFFRIRGRVEVHPKYGEQIAAITVEPVQPTAPNAVIKYLETLPGIGPAYAEKIVTLFGADAIEILEKSPDKVSAAIKGLTPQESKEASRVLRNRKEDREAMLFLQELGLSSAIAMRIVMEWHTKTIAIVKANPYRIAREIRGVGFATADQVARALGFPPNSPQRHEAGILCALEELSYKGHTCVPLMLLVRGTEALLGAYEPTALDALRRADEVVCYDDGMVALIEFDRAEKLIALKIELLQKSRHAPPDIPKTGPVAQNIQAFSLEQQGAIEKVIGSAVSVLTGGPGVGKTTVLNAIAAVWSSKRREVLLAAPTGRAAKRLEEATGFPACTVHRLLEWVPGVGPKRNSATPLTADLVIVDEASMLDVTMAKYLFDALPTGCSILLVGDADQLPSVGPGRVLQDIIGSGKVEVAKLTEIFRQSAGSSISLAAADVLRGNAPTTASSGDLRVEHVYGQEEAQRLVVDLITRTFPSLGFPSETVKVLIPMYKGSCGIYEINRVLQATLNPYGEAVERGDKPPLREKDPVIQLKNNYDLGVMNGDIGTVTKVDAKARQLIISFGGNPALYNGSTMLDLELAYAMSVHKSQGSEYAATVVVMLSEQRPMLKRNLLYTALTRGKRLVALVGQPEALHQAAQTPDTDVRFTKLGEWLAEIAG